MAQKRRERKQDVGISMLVFGGSLLLLTLGFYVFVSSNDFPPLGRYAVSSGMSPTKGISLDKILDTINLPRDINLAPPQFNPKLRPKLAEGFVVPSAQPTAILLDRNLIAQQADETDFGPEAELVVPQPPPLFPENFVALEYTEESLTEEAEVLPPDPGLLFLGVVQASDDGPLSVLLKDLRNNEIVQLGENDRYGDLEVSSVNYHSALFRLPDGQVRRVTTRETEVRFLPRTGMHQLNTTANSES